MKNFFLLKQSFKVLLIAVSLILLLPCCNTGDEKNEVALLLEKQTFIIAQRDSLQRLLAVNSARYDTVYANLNKRDEDYKTLESKNKSLQSGYYKRGAELKKLTEENATLNNTINEKSAENESIKKEVAALQQKVTAIDNQKAETEKNNAALAQTLKIKEEKIVADSLAEANKPIPPKESGFISVTEIGGGFGLGDVSVDYSKSLFSFNTMAGYRINKHFLTGIGAGVHVYNGGTLVPLYLNVRYSFNGGKVTPFLFTDGGVNVYFKDIMSSGLFLNPGIGLEKKLSNKVSLHLSTGVLVNQSPVGLRYSFINIRGGISFRGK